MSEVTRNDAPHAISYIALATGALAIGAIAVGAIAIGRMVIGRLAIQKVRLRTVEIDNLTVRRLRVLESITPEPQSVATDAHSSAAPPEKNGEERARPVPRRRRPRKPVSN
jgi:hypothetical protein